MLNRVILIGRLTRDPELRYTPNGNAVTSFALAVDRFRTNQAGEKETDFINIVVWGKAAESTANNMAKGCLIAVDGRLQTRSYEAKDGSGRRYVTEVVAENVRFLTWPKDGQRSSGNADFNDFSDFGTEINYSEDDIPF
jgi:single-strand DNA-binding protein